MPPGSTIKHWHKCEVTGPAWLVLYERMSQHANPGAFSPIRFQENLQFSFSSKICFGVPFWPVTEQTQRPITCIYPFCLHVVVAAYTNQA